MPASARTSPSHGTPDRIATRLRQTAASVDLPVGARLQSFELEYAVREDIANLHRLHDLRQLHIASQRRALGQLTVRFKRLLQRALYPLPDVQTTLNEAGARVTTFLLRQLAAQARSIEALEEQVQELQEKLERDDPMAQPIPRHQAQSASTGAAGAPGGDSEK